VTVAIFYDFLRATHTQCICSAVYSMSYMPVSAYPSVRPAHANIANYYGKLETAELLVKLSTLDVSSQ